MPVEALAAAFPNAALTQGYGLTEGGNSVCVLAPGEALERPGSVGRPMSGVEIRIAELRAAGAPIDTSGVGTDLVTSIDAPALGGS